MSIVKICGLRDAANAKVAAENGADLLGFIFAPSRRQVSAVEVAGILADLRAAGYGTPAVGVFVDPDPDELEDAIRVGGIDLVQLAGDESPDLIARIPVPVIKVLPAGDADVLVDLRDRTDCWSGAKHIHLDASDPNARGGTGKRANWSLASKLAQHIPLILAGGLDPNNVQHAIETVRPGGVDVSSGVETNGVKDPEKIVQFIQNARAAFAVQSAGSS